ncbi:hypothetical protein FOMG_19696 [Fusarium oxysporum f. sp. melonis 26406]|uniref:Uncharacterized protein n=1 Tax=Fusarium oxysporum f. sp. melonis 26406 TaxID=1089452 RepID=W9ZR13_FUSOX|nr:hypothetical protein FOMG_19696 [Fusarium oxysporum f. sp. melonis 26406]
MEGVGCQCVPNDPSATRRNQISLSYCKRVFGPPDATL